MDDVGIDQFRLFGYGGIDAMKTPTIDALAAGGVMFRNTWVNPDCSPSRVSMLTGRYSIHTNVTTAIQPPDLAFGQINPYEITMPTILRKNAGYSSALFGKSHYANTPSTNYPYTVPYGGNCPTQLGWSEYYGWFNGAPDDIDTTAGGIAPEQTYICGYVPSKAINSTTGADTGACYFVDGSCTVMNLDTAHYQSPGMECMVKGGILVPNAACTSPCPSYVDFSIQNGYYAGELISIPGRVQQYQASPPESPSGVARGYRTTIEANMCIDWINSRCPNKPWFAALAFSAAHTPIQPAPLNLIYSKDKASLPDSQDCSSAMLPTKMVFNTMVEALDMELGRVLVETGIATRNPDGTINYDPKASNTLIVVIGDNGSFGPTVKAPFDPYLAKGYVYQTGVWVPLIVSGPMVVQPGREVNAMVNGVDLFQLFGEVAGVDVRQAVPSTRALDAESMLPYLTNANQTSIRKCPYHPYCMMIA